MQYVEANGARIPALGLGTWDLHGAAEIVEQTLRLGYRYIDTAEMYGTETEVGEGLRASGVARDEVFITTKVWPDHLAPAALERAAKASLARGLAGGAGVGLRGSVERRRPAAGPENTCRRRAACTAATMPDVPRRPRRRDAAAPKARGRMKTRGRM
jgi:hypothetical protein